MSRQEGPIKPEPRPLRLEKPATAIAVLDLSVRCDDPGQVCSQLMADLRTFLDRARAAGVPIVFTCSYSAKGTPEGEVAKALNRRPTETVIYPDAFDKFAGGELGTFLQQHGTRNLIIVGSATHVAVMYTASAAARVHKYDVVIPLDGVNSGTAYEHEYALHQLSVIPGGAAARIQFTKLPTIEFV
jgi:nicotinamidase-related amidase